MIVNNQGKLQLTTNTKAQKVFSQVKTITSIFIDKAVKVEGGYLIPTDSLKDTTKTLTNFLKHQE